MQHRIDFAMAIARARRTVMTMFLFLLSVTSLVYGGTTGKISGRIIDIMTREPLIGANVLIAGTRMGGTTDIEGEYFIINVPPGLYTIKASLIGYTSEAVEKVRVQVDLTSKQNLGLSPTTVQVTKEIIITAKREIQKDLSSSERTFQSDQITALPARDITSMLSMQAGITKDANGDLHIRGGRTSEISYMVDGVQVMNALNRSAGISIDDQSIEELKAITGTFNAEYGQALSGVVNIVTKKGADRLTINATAYTSGSLSFDNDLYSIMSDRKWAEAAATALTQKNSEWMLRYVPNHFFDYSQYGITNSGQLAASLANQEKPWLTKESYLNTFKPFARYDVQVNISGPVSDSVRNLSFFVAGRYQNSPSSDMGRRYFMPSDLWKPVSDTTHTFEMPDGALVPLGRYEGASGQAKIFYSLSNLNLSYGLYFNHDHSYGGGQKYLPDGGRNYYTDRATHIVSATYIFTPATFLDFKGSYYTNISKSYLYEDPYDFRYMPTNAGDFQQYVFRPANNTGAFGVEVKNNPNDFSYWGNDVGRSANFAKYFSGTLDLTSQVDKYNMIKIGASGRMHDLQDDNYSLQFSEVNYRPIVPDKSSAFHTFYSAKPYEIAAYVQDKIEFEELIINLGVRLDYFYSDGRVLADEKDPQLYKPFKFEHIYVNPDAPDSLRVEQTPEQRGQYWYKKPSPKYQISPRFGFSFPITADGVIHFSYGHFFQNPEFQYLYTNPNFWVTGAGAQTLVGNADLNAERTVMYELGLQQRMFENLFLHVTAFYRDIRDWIGTGYPVDTYSGLTYYSYVNKENAVAKGLTISGQYQMGDLNLSVDYTMMQAKGSASNPQDAYNDISAKKAPRVQLISLNWDQTHAVNMIASYSKNSWTGTLVGAVASGFPYTPQVARSEATGSNAILGWKENSETKPTTINFDLHVAKYLSVGDVKLQVMLDVTNLFDTRNARNVYGDTGLPDFTLQDYMSSSRLLEISNSTEYFRNSGMYSSPRSISLGIRVSYN